MVQLKARRRVVLVRMRFCAALHPAKRGVGFTADISAGLPVHTKDA